MKQLIILLLCLVVILGAASLFLLRKDPQSGHTNMLAHKTDTFAHNTDTLAHKTDSISHLENETNDVVVTEISEQEYRQLIKDSCNVRLSIDSTKFKDTEDSLTIFTAKGAITLLDLPYEAEMSSDFAIVWQYDGFDPKNKLSFFSFSGHENWGYYAVNNLGDVSEFDARDTPIFCKDTDLFATCLDDPYEGRFTLNIYKIRPDGRLAQVVVIDLGEYNTAHNHVWVKKNVLVAEKHLHNEEASTYIQVHLPEKILNNDPPLPIADLEKYNNLVRELKSDHKESV